MYIITRPSLILLLDWISLNLFYAAHADDITYIQEQIVFHVFENASIGSVVSTDLRAQLQLSSDRQVRLGPGTLSSFFHLSNDNTLVVAKSLDLESEELCHVEKSCCRAENENFIEGGDFFSRKNGLGNFQSNRFGNFHSDSHSCKLSAIVLANSVGSVSLKPVLRIGASIQDVNDNSPIFMLQSRDVERNPTDGNSAHSANRLYITFVEGPDGVRERVELPTAVDSDFLPENSMIKYFLSMKSFSGQDVNAPYNAQKYDISMSTSKAVQAWNDVGPFRLVYKNLETSLFLEVIRELDREVKDEYQLVLHAEDPGGRRTSLDLQINVLDVNEYPPTFVGMKELGSAETVDLKVIHIYENASVHRPIIQILAEDKDAPPANTILYKLGPSVPPHEVMSIFTLEPRTGKLVLESPLDYERTKQYKLSILAIDANYEAQSNWNQFQSASAKKAFDAVVESIRSERKTATMTLDIRVLDCNDNEPEIKFQGTAGDSTPRSISGINMVEVMENSPSDTSVVFFSAIDRDLGEAGQTMCRLLNWTDRFRINNFPDFYSLETTGPLDREEISEYLLTIECSDSGEPSISSKKMLKVSVLDENDEAPQFSRPVYAFHVTEGSTPGVQLSLVGDRQPSAAKAIDRDTNSSIRYHLEPSTSSNYEQETEALTDQSTTFDYQMFTVDPLTAQLFTKSPIDREMREIYRFSLCASDGENKACTGIAVHLDDINDNPPKFERETYIIRLVENEQIFKPLITFHVEDPDIGNQGFSFTLEPSHSANKNDSVDTEKALQSYFTIRENKLFLRQPLDRETQAHHHFFVRATDSQKGTSKRESLSNTAEIFVEVADINDNSPVFLFPNGNSENDNGNRLNVSCRETMGSFIGRIEAIDLDLGQNGTIVYSVLEGPISNKLFYLDKQSGKIFVNSGGLMENCDSIFLLVVSADDQGPLESKKGRPLPVQRLLIQLQDQPTLAELLSAKSNQLLDNNEGGGHGASQLDGAYFGLPAKTMLSVVLGGCIVFLAGLFLAWVILLLFNRSKRRRREERAQRDYQSQRCIDVGALSIGSNQEVFVHPIGTYSQTNGIPKDVSALQCTMEHMKGIGKKDLHADASLSSRTSPCGQSLNADHLQQQQLGGERGSLTNIPLNPSSSFVERINRNSPFNKLLDDHNGTMGKFKREGPDCLKTVGEVLSANALKYGDHERCCSPAGSIESTRYLLFPGAALATEIGTPPMSKCHAVRESTLPPKSTAKVSKCDLSNALRSRSLRLTQEKQRCQSQHFPQPYIVIDPQGQNLQHNRIPGPFLTPPETRKYSDDVSLANVVQNRHFKFPESEYTSLVSDNNDSKNPNQYLMISRTPNNATTSHNRDNEVLEGRLVHDTSGQTFSLLRSPRHCSKSSMSSVSQATAIDTTLNEATSSPTRQLILTQVDGHKGILVLPKSPPNYPQTEQPNSICIDPQNNAPDASDFLRLQTQRAVTSDSSAGCPTEYISLEDLLNSCV